MKRAPSFNARTLVSTKRARTWTIKTWLFWNSNTPPQPCPPTHPPTHPPLNTNTNTNTHTKHTNTNARKRTYVPHPVANFIIPPHLLQYHTQKSPIPPQKSPIKSPISQKPSSHPTTHPSAVIMKARLRRYWALYRALLRRYKALLRMI